MLHALDVLEPVMTTFAADVEGIVDSQPPSSVAKPVLRGALQISLAVGEHGMELLRHQALHCDSVLSADMGRALSSGQR